MSSDNRIMLALYLTPQEDQQLKRAARHTSKGKLDMLGEWIESGIRQADEAGAEATFLTKIEPHAIDESTAIKRNVYISIISDSRARQLANDVDISKDDVIWHCFKKGLAATLSPTV